MSANDKQVAGQHYKRSDYQHWDWVTDIRLPYLPAQATRYFYRWRDKNGFEDVAKGIHYLEKWLERGDVEGSPMSAFRHQEHTDRFIKANNIHPQEGLILHAIAAGDIAHAARLAGELSE